jgi:hypothetical protein
VSSRPQPSKFVESFLHYAILQYRQADRQVVSESAAGGKDIRAPREAISRSCVVLSRSAQMFSCVRHRLRAAALLLVCAALLHSAVGRPQPDVDLGSRKDCQPEQVCPL